MDLYRQRNEIIDSIAEHEMGILDHQKDIKRLEIELEQIEYQIDEDKRQSKADAIYEEYREHGMVNLAHDLCGIDPLGDYKGHHEPFKFQNEQLGYREHWSSIGRENRP